MVRVLRTNSENGDFIELVAHLDAELAVRDGNEHSFYAQFNRIHRIKNVVVVYDDQLPIGCGAIKHYRQKVVEVKRMYTAPQYRGKGIASLVLSELEKWAAELSYEKCILETGLRQPEAIRLYIKSGYILIPNYGQYVKVDNSRCFEKIITKNSSTEIP